MLLSFVGGVIVVLLILAAIGYYLDFNLGNIRRAQETYNHRVSRDEALRETHDWFVMEYGREPTHHELWQLCPPWKEE